MTRKPSGSRQLEGNCNGQPTIASGTRCQNFHNTIRIERREKAYQRAKPRVHAHCVESNCSSTFTRWQLCSDCEQRKHAHEKWQVSRSGMRPAKRLRNTMKTRGVHRALKNLEREMHECYTVADFQPVPSPNACGYSATCHCSFAAICLRGNRLSQDAGSVNRNCQEKQKEAVSACDTCSKGSKCSMRTDARLKQ